MTLLLIETFSFFVIIYFNPSYTERCTTAREAIQMMGDLAMEYGYYSADWSGGDGSKGEGGEVHTCSLTEGYL